ncbi:MAG: tryptophan synthase subunit alpha [bacterium]
MNRLKKVIQTQLQQRQKVLSIYLTAGYPKMESAVDLICTVAEAGADFVELGAPFSDPLADGPIIQQASQTALDNGMSLAEIFLQVEKVREKSAVPIVLMSYLNPLLSYGLKNLIKVATSVGIDGFIIPDLIPEEFTKFKESFANSELGLNFLISPNTPSERVRWIDNLTSDFIYCVSAVGVTGPRGDIFGEVGPYLDRVAKLVKHPYFVGFGISSSDDARMVAPHCHGVIVGSAVIDIMAKCSEHEIMLKQVKTFVKNIKNAITGD